ncbi:MAG TPA: 2Fe-2S iron-sulfur cluster-binding protein [Hyphomicrobiaceae bacterium]|nr:2Fe-2S iron-sulfur cluster-binding protein [Hyphomicrobiaceae bacterium]
MIRIGLTVNGRKVSAEVAPRTHLADFLREHLLLTGTHIGCEHGICGACTVEIDGEIARSCITFAAACDGASITTIEGFDDDAPMARLRQAFTEAHALQCGYCTPGMLIAARDLVRRKGRLSRAEIRKEMSGNLCRCTGYQGIIDAVERVMQDGGSVADAPAKDRRWLGPMPGPAAGVDADAANPPVAAQRRMPPPPALSRPAGPATITVRVGPVEQSHGETRISQSFDLPHPLDAVWDFMSDIEKVAQCMPGVTLDGAPAGELVSGRLEARVGPIAASFAGQGTIRTMPEEHRQVIQGQGGDRKSGSRASGSVDYRLSPADAGSATPVTRVDVVISYTLAGPLAQIGRSGLVRDLVRRIGEAFAQNVDARLRDPAANLPTARLGGLTLLWQVVSDRARAAWRSLFARRG